MNSKSTCSASNYHLPLSRIHRLIRPLKSSINSLSQCIKNQKERQQQQKLMLVKKHFYSQPKSSKAYLQDQQDYLHSTASTSRKRYTSKKVGSRRKNTATNPISSPIFHPNTPNPPPKNQALITQHHQIELEIKIKIEKIILAYKNILDSTTTHQSKPRPESDQAMDKLTTICARVIGNFIEHAISLEANHHDVPGHDGSDGSEIQAPVSLLTELDWKTSVMDEWYDAIPLLYRRYALAQHALKMILSDFPPQPLPKQPKRTIAQPANYPQNLFQAIHAMHKSYPSHLIRSQANLLLPSLFSLPTTNWFEIYDYYSHKFNLEDRFTMEFYARLSDSSFLEFCSDRALIGFIDLTMHVFGSWVIEKWIHQRESLIKSRLAWRSKHEACQAGLESSDAEDLEPGMMEDAITEYDKQTSSILTKWIQSLVMNCLPNSVHCKSARIQLNAISRLIFDSLVAFNLDVCSKSDNYFLTLISVTIESHRLALFGLPMFNTGSTGKPDSNSEWFSLHTPMRLQALIPKVVTSFDQKIFNKAAKLFFRAHRSTRLLAILPGLLSTRHQPVIPGLDELLEFVIRGEYSIEFVAKSWVESLLKSDPKSWWIEADSNTTSANSRATSEDDDEIRSKGAQDVRAWLENWLPILDEAEKLRSNLSDHAPSDDHQSEDEDDVEHALHLTTGHPRDSHEGPLRLVDNRRLLEPPPDSVHQQDLEDTKPCITCTCSSNFHQSLVQQTVWEEDESKPEITMDPTDNNNIMVAAPNNEIMIRKNSEETDESTTMKPLSTSTSQQQHDLNRQIRVVVPMNKKRRRKSSLLTLPSTRLRTKRKKSSTPTPIPLAAPVSSSSSRPTNGLESHNSNTSRGKRGFVSDVCPPSSRLQDEQSRGFVEDDDDNDDDEDQFDTMDLLVPRVKTHAAVLPPPPSSSSLVAPSVNTSRATPFNSNTSHTINIKPVNTRRKK